MIQYLVVMIKSFNKNSFSYHPVLLYLCRAALAVTKPDFCVRRLEISALMRRFHGERLTSLFFDHVQSWEGVVSSVLKY